MLRWRGTVASQGLKKGNIVILALALKSLQNEGVSEIRSISGAAFGALV